MDSAHGHGYRSIAALSRAVRRWTGPWRAIVAVPLQHQGHVFAALPPHLRSGDPRGRSAAARRRWCDEHRRQLAAAAATIAERWQPGSQT